MMSVELPPNERPKAVRTNENSRNIMSGSMIGGIVLVTLGVIFLLQTTGLLGRLPFEFNWWVLFILIPASAAANSAWQTYQANGEQFNREVRSKAAGAAILLLVTTVLLFDLNWGMVWPLLLIIGGIAILLGTRGSVTMD